MSDRMFAFIRAINTGNRRLTNEQVLAPFRAAGLVDVAAYQAAGNVTFRSSADPIALGVDLTALLTDAYGFEAPTFVRSADELRGVVAASPFAPEVVAAGTGKVQVAFLASAPDADRVVEALALVPPDDRVVFVGRQWFWLPRGGVSESALPVAGIERIVGPMTMRTLGTVERMLARYPD